MRPVGVLSFQGDFARHIEMCSRLGVETVQVRDGSSIDGCEALIIPGGESTTIGMLSERFGVTRAVRKRMSNGMPVLGTCAGTILLANEVEGPEQPLFGGVPISVARNAYGRQIESFEDTLVATDAGEAAGLAEPPVLGVFIRAPIVTTVGDGVEVLLTHENRPVLLRYESCLLATYHPELTDDTRTHELFLRMIWSVRG